ncbi:hypothetical protein tb265_16380 [Gemmatimonadetes bacterium T265]|nr:hypothetical protein tb265_16380 [Gemmatimonadetes bacterium T265]
MTRRLGYAAGALATIALGLAVHRGGIPLPPAARDVSGDALWAAMVFWWIGVGWPRASTSHRAGAALAVAFGVEFSQCYHAPGIDAARATTLGHLVLGSDFDPRDLLAYALGVGVAAVVERAVVGPDGRATARPVRSAPADPPPTPPTPRRS